MLFLAKFHDRLNVWTIVADYSAVGGSETHICRADSEYVARETSRLMNEAYS